MFSWRLVQDANQVVMSSYWQPAVKPSIYIYSTTYRKYNLNKSPCLRKCTGVLSSRQGIDNFAHKSVRLILLATRTASGQVGASADLASTGIRMGHAQNAMNDRGALMSMRQLCLEGVIAISTRCVCQLFSVPLPIPDLLGTDQLHVLPRCWHQCRQFLCT